MLFLVFVWTVTACTNSSSSGSTEPGESRPTTTTTTRPPGPPPPAVPARGAYFGIWRGPGPGRPDDAILSTQQAEDQIGRRFAIDNRYYDWGAPVPGPYERWTADGDRIPMVSICACRFDDDSYVRWADIASGAEDAYITAIATEFARWGVPAFLVFDSEPEVHLATHGTPAEYRAAWRRVVEGFRAAGATNVAFVWATTSYELRTDVGDRDLVEQLYPGDDLVDWIGVDPYNFNENGDWESFADVVDPWYRWVTRLHPDKPLMMVEWGSKEDPERPDRKAAWLLDALVQLRERYPKIRAAVYFDEEKHERGTVNDWRTDTSPAALTAFAALGHSRWFAPGR
jgi:hypothetical protein